MSSCAFNAPNGAKSDLYNQLYQQFGETTATKNWIYTKTDDFKSWFGNGVTDSNGEPKVNEFGEFTNEKGETMKAQMHHKDYPTLEDTVSQIENLKAIFEKAGIPIEVEFDGDMDNIGQVIGINGKAKITFNPRTIQKDSVFHEFGHIYVDILGFDNPIIQRGIEHLKGTELWNKLEKIYPELNDVQFAKEVLTTAIGLEAAKEFDYHKRYQVEKGKDLLGKIAAWKFWVSNFFKRISELLGINQSVAKRLAYDLVGGKLKNTITKKISDYYQKQKAPITIQELIKRGQNRVRLSEDEQHYIADDEKDKPLQRVTTALDSLKQEFDREAQIKKTAEKTGRTPEQVAEEWADKREEGTGIHLLSETYIHSRNAGLSREASITAALQKIYKPEKAGELDEDKVRIYSGMSEELVKGYINDIADYIDFLLDKGYKLYPEVKIFDKELGLAGTIDLLIVKPNGNIIIYDWKTKENGKFDSFYTVFKGKNLLNILSDVPQTKANEYSLQLSTYKLMLERLGFTVEKLGIIPVVGEITTNEKGENRYKDLHILENEITEQDEDGVLEIQDLSEKLKLVFNAKDEIETMIENIDEGNQELSEMENTSNDLDILAKSTSKFLQEINVELQRSISRMRATADVETALKFENIVKDLMKKLIVEDETQAIISYTKFVNDNLTALYRRMYDKVEVTNIDGRKESKLVKGYDSYVWQDIKNLEETDKKQYMEFLAFLINSDMFINQIVKIKSLPFTDNKQSNIVLKALKDQEARISDFQFKLNRLNKELDKRYVELSSNPLYGGRGVLENTEQFFKSQVDESFMQRNFDAMADTHNNYIANVIRLYDYKMRVMKDEQDKILKEWNKAVKELEESGSDISRFVDPTTAKVYAKVDYNAFYNARSEMFKQATEKHKKGTKGFQNAINSWFNTNVVIMTAEEIKELEDKKKLELGINGFNEWRAKQVYKDLKGNFHYSKTSAYYKPNPNVWTTAQYKSFTPAEIKFYNFLNNTLHYLVEHTKTSVIKDGYIPSVPNNDKGFGEQLLHKIGWYDKGVYNSEDGVIVNEAGEVVQFLPFQYNNLLNQEKYLRANTPEEREEVVAKNKEIFKRNKEAHAQAVNKNLKETMPTFIKVALRNKHKKAMEFEMLRVKKSYETNFKVAVEKGNKPVIDKIKKFAGLENNEVEKSTLGSNTLKHYEDWLKMVFYEEFEKDEGTFQKLARVLQNYTSFKGMALNALSAINNQVYATLMSRIEGLAGQHFSIGNWEKASFEYNKGIVSYFGDNPENQEFSSKQSAFMHKFEILQSHTELADGDTNASIATKSLAAVSWAFSKAYAMEHLTEHNVQNRTLLAMAMSHRVVNGQIISFEEYKRGKLKPVDASFKTMTEQEAKENISFNKQKSLDLQAEFEKYTTVYEAYEMNQDNELLLKEGVNINPNEIAEFQRKVIGVNQYLHGIYNKEDAGAIQQYALGRLAMQFRKWMRSGWNKRWGSRFGEGYFNERRNVYEEGYYVTTVKFLARPIMSALNEYNGKKGTAEEISFLRAMSNIGRDYARMLSNIKVHWHSLSDSEKANIKRTFFEYLAFCTMIGIAFALKSMKGDDDEPPLALMLMLYQADRTATELTTYVPLAVAPGFVGGGWLNESKKLLKSPTATFSSLESAIKIGRELISYPFAEEEDLYYKGGVYDGQHRLQSQVLRMIPIVNQGIRFNTLSENYKYYKLF